MTPDAKYQSMLDAARDEAILEEQRQHDAKAITEAMECVSNVGSASGAARRDAEPLKVGHTKLFGPGTHVPPRDHVISHGVRIAEAAMRLGSPYSAFQAQAARADAARRVVIEVTSMDALLARLANREHAS